MKIPEIPLTTMGVPRSQGQMEMENIQGLFWADHPKWPPPSAIITVTT